MIFKQFVFVFLNLRHLFNHKYLDLHFAFESQFYYLVNILFFSQLRRAFCLFFYNSQSWCLINNRIDLMSLKIDLL